jgi:hypothetical protein
VTRGDREGCERLAIVKGGRADEPKREYPDAPFSDTSHDMPASSTKTARRGTPASSKKTAPRGRPARRVFINVSVRESTRKSLNVLTRRHGVTQGELLDLLLAGKLQLA